MALDFEKFNDTNLKENFVQWLIEDRWVDINSHFGRFWDYYANSIEPLTTLYSNKLSTGKTYTQSQEQGLPARITGTFNGRPIDEIQRKEVVIENDISWRINAIVDFLFGRNIKIISKSPDSGKAGEIEKIINAVFDANGGITFFQNLAVLGSVYGFVDCLVRCGQHIFSHFKKSPKGSRSISIETIQSIASQINLELIEATRALPILDENDYRKILYYVQNFTQNKNQVIEKGGFVSKLFSGRESAKNRQRVMISEITGANFWQRYENMKLIEQGINPLGFIPLVHIQNMAQPYYYEGASDVEPLVPLQDELNTRLSDRASRVTFQSFKMYLAKGIDGFENRPVSPGRMWCTDNPDASIQAFGGDADSPSEDAHIAEIRQAMDKASGVTPVVAGVLQDKIGNLTSAVAIKLTMMGMLAKNQRKQFTYGQGIKNIVDMILEIFNKGNIYHTSKQDRQIEIIFADPIPENITEKLNEAKLKLQLGVSKANILKELGYN